MEPEARDQPTCATGRVLHKLGEVVDGEVAGSSGVRMRDVFFGAKGVERGTRLWEGRRGVRKDGEVGRGEVRREKRDEI